MRLTPRRPRVHGHATANGQTSPLTTPAAVPSFAAWAACALCGVALLSHCSRAEPPSWDAAPLSASVAALPSALAALPATQSQESPRNVDAGPPTAAAAASAAVDPGKLPQTQDKPDPSGPAFDAHVGVLWDAIVLDAPERALPFFFPVTAYAQIKDIPNPPADWNARLVSAFKRDIHALHGRLGANTGGAKLAKLEVPSERARWVNPHEEMNTGGYWRVYGTKLKFELDGKEKSFDVASLISWRGEWYVVHLNGFK